MLEGTTTTNFIGYNQPVGLSLSNGSTSNRLTTTIFDWTQFNGGNINITPNSGGSYTTLSQTITNTNNMVKQVRVAVFTVERNEDNKVISSTFVKELWVEVKNGASLELAVAKHLDKDFDASKTVIKELQTVQF